MNTTDSPHVVFAHGKESGPWGSKIQRLADVAAARGFSIDSLDYQGMDDASERVALLERTAPGGTPLVLVGSSMGGYVSAMGCSRLRPRALLLMAPALYLPGYPGEPEHCPADTVVVHGWRDDVVPIDSSLRFSRDRRAELHVLDDGHRLAASIEFIARIFDAQLERALVAARGLD